MQVFRPVLNVKVEFSIEELESALLKPNALLDAIHIALLKVFVLSYFLHIQGYTHFK